MKTRSRTAGMLGALVILCAPSAFALPPGDPDLSFGGTGRVTTDVGGEGRSTVVLVQTDGKIVLGGTRTVAASQDFALTRYGADGVLDSSFGTGGKVTTELGSDTDQIVRVLEQPDGKLIAVGQSAFHIILARYLADGSLDSSFGFGGKASTDCGGGCSVADAVLQPDGAIVAAGGRFDTPSGGPDFQLVRYLPDGTLDAGFGAGGVVLTDFPSGRQDTAFALALQTDGKLIATGVTVTSATDSNVGVVRYDTNGSLDPTFGTGGFVVPTSAQHEEGFDVALYPDGRMLVSSRDSIIRMLPDGSLDPTFGTGGVSATTGAFPHRIAIQSSGDIVAAFEGTGSGIHLWRFDPQGVLDPTFGVGGKVPTGLFGSFLGGTHVDLALQPDDRIVVAGIPDTTDALVFTALRYAGSPVLRCAATPLSGCKAPTAPGRAQLRLDRRHGDRKLKWRWGRGAATSAADVGHPDDTDHYAFCLYDESGPAALVLETVAPSGGSCAGKSCWQAKSAGRFVYRDRQATPLGMTAMTIKSGDTTQAGVDAAGANLPPLPLPAPLPLRAQLQSSTGACWEAVFSTASQPGYSEVFSGKSN